MVIALKGQEGILSYFAITSIALVLIRSLKQKYSQSPKHEGLYTWWRLTILTIILIIIVYGFLISVCQNALYTYFNLYIKCNLTNA
ncbi:hypothetical protein EROM_030010 [Encephalitozoon romaleae SJ-2008]|uniref:Uncharacterized protein n=1 Tax=Encephalitozoon romaleae (strain SJ-2008) TaxID=1178016 RepID=I7ADE8_ENCRO|nr:hypothetical protein EROM_030010 [Encephalitozoon romaleae SJ-2008]AFN82620.1 hypothetical protein EROM_030010 [Encephalitozoon romaleae SJ-2008]